MHPSTSLPFLPSLRGVALVFGAIAGTSTVLPAAAQPVPAADGTGTQVLREGDRFNIQGGTVADRNLFHGFEDFMLDAGQVANFQSPAEIQNIFGRVIGGNPSAIDGLLQVTGSDANLFLINPAGIVFGPNARLDVPGDLFATTATGIGFGNGELDVLGANDWSRFVGDPTSYRFDTLLPGSVVNLGELAVASGSRLTLMGGTVVNGGTLEASEGNVALVGVPGQNLVRLTLAGNLLSIELSPTVAASRFLAPNLAELLTNGSLGHADRLQVTSDGTVMLTGSEVAIPTEPGTAIASGEIDATGTIGGTIDVVGTRVGVLDGRVDASGSDGGGRIRIGGDLRGGGDIPNALATWIDGPSVLRADAIAGGNGGNIIAWASDTTRFDGAAIARGGSFGGDGGFIEISGKQRLVLNGRVDLTAVEDLGGNAGTLLIDPENLEIVPGSVGSDALNIDPFATSLIVTPDPAIDGTSQVPLAVLQTIPGEIRLEADANITVASGISIIFAAGNGSISFVADADNNGIGSFQIDANQEIATSGRALSISGASLVLGEIDTTAGAGPGGALALNATNGNITAGSIDASSDTANGGTVSMMATGSVTVSEIITLTDGLGNGGTIAIEADAIAAGDLTASAIAGNGGNVTLTAAGGIIETAAIDVSSTSVGNAGIVMLSGAGANLAGEIDASANQGAGGNVTIAAPGNISVAGIDTSASNSGTIFLSSDAGDIDTTAGILQSSSIEGNGGAISLMAAGNLVVGNVLAFGSDGGGNLTLMAGGALDGVGLLDASATNGFGGNISLNAAGNINTGDVSALGDFGGNISLNTAGNINTGDVSALGDAQGGNVEIGTVAQIVAGAIATSSTSGSGGNVTLNGMEGIQITSIDAQGSSSGSGGIVNANTQGFFQAMVAFEDNQGTIASISTAAGQGGAIAIEHGGGDTVPATPFVVGDATTNGTAGSVTSGDNTVAPETFFGSFTQGNINFIATGEAPPPEPEPEPSPEPEPEPELPVEPTAPILMEITTANNDSATTTNADSESSTSEIENENLAVVAVPEQSTEVGEATEAIAEEVEEELTQEFIQNLDLGVALSTMDPLSFEETQTLLRNIETQTGVKSALIYARFRGRGSDASRTLLEVESAELLEIVAITADNPSEERFDVPEASLAEVRQAISDLRGDITTPLKRRLNVYLQPSQKLYGWIIEPIAEELQRAGVDNLAFVLGNGLRGLPIAALHDGENFLVERYSLGLIPSLSLTDVRYANVADAEVLAMGTSEFNDASLEPLPAVPVEVQLINRFWPGDVFVGEDFTLDNLIGARSQKSHRIVHLATHAQFQPRNLRESFVQIGRDEKLRLNQLRRLGWNDPPVDLLVLSACRTAVGDRQSELGFAGLSVSAGVKSSIASLWYVDDEGTLALMSELYKQLQSAPITAEALRQAQLALLRGEVKIREGELVGSFGSVPLPPEVAAGNIDFSHPFFWSGFTVVGSPW